MLKNLLRDGARLLLNHDSDRHFYETLNIPQYTPDLSRLQQFSTQFVLSYWPGMLQDIPLDQATIYGNAFTEDTGFMMWKKILGDKSFPIPMGYQQSVPENSYLTKMKEKREGQTRLLYPPGRIGGKLYLLKNPAHWMVKLDNQALNTLYFTRQRVKVMIPYGAPGWEPQIAYVNAWCYLGEMEYWRDQIVRSEGRSTLVAPIDVFRAKKKTIGNYYYFTELEFNCPETIDWKDSTWSYSTESTAKERRKRLMNLNKDLKPYVPARRG